nr:MAG TPA: hypothetical protein [Caudoviricetes sp.]DAT12303.1 MAG TPA: hypothetical protein [Crassvirales sp.]DAV43046.1 MAG TPA: hypothetical protein [Caudoviricetes sp.]
MNTNFFIGFCLLLADVCLPLSWIQKYAFVLNYASI